MARRREDESGERTRQPTPLRLAEARRTGRVPRSAELTSAAAALGCLLVLALVGPGLLNEMTKMTATFLDGRSVGIDASAAALRDLAVRGAGASVAMVCGLLVASAGLAALVGLAQVGAVFAADRIRPDAARISPRAGLERLLSPRTLVRAGLTIAKLAAVAAVAYCAVRPALPRLAAASGLDAWQLAAEAGRLVGGVAVRVGLCLLAVAGVDFLYQRWQHRRDLRMTRREWAEDMRTMEGDAHVRRRRREIARQLGDWRAAREVPSASVVLFDPHGCAAALRRAGDDRAPVVVAKGRGFSALRIRRAAEAAGVPAVAAAAAAREIHRRCRTGEEIPQALCEVVAGLLAACRGCEDDSGENHG